MIFSSGALPRRKENDAPGIIDSEPRHAFLCAFLCVYGKIPHAGYMVSPAGGAVVDKIISPGIFPGILREVCLLSDSRAQGCFTPGPASGVSPRATAGNPFSAT